jgi:hypothetical protein
MNIDSDDLAAIIEEELVEKLGIDDEELIQEIVESIIDRAEDESMFNESDNKFDD